MKDESVYYPFAYHVTDYVRNVDGSALRTAVHKYVLQPFNDEALPIPTEPNAFSDGSVNFPTQQEWATATFGVVHMKDIHDELELNELELLFTHVTVGQRDEFGAFYCCRAPIFGGHYSSSRAELAGVLLAVSVRWPVRLALDNLSIVQGLEQLLVSDLQLPKKPWSLLTNGDLWELVYKLLCWRRGKHSTAVQWCKGHALDCHLQSGVSNPFLAWGNDMADKEAERAHGMLSDCEHLCLALRAKQTDYVAFLVAVHAMFVRVIRTEKTLREERARPFSRLLPLKLPHRSVSLLQARLLSTPAVPDPLTGITLPSMLDASILDSLDIHDTNVLCFLSNARWALPGELNSLGTTWLELLIAYAFSGGTLACAAGALKVPTFRQAIKELRSRMRRLVSLALAPQHHDCFAPYGISFVRLACMGVATLLPGIQGKMCLSADMQAAVFELILSITHRMKNAKAKAALRGEVRVFPARFPLRRRADLFQSAPRSCFQHLCAARDVSDGVRQPHYNRPSQFHIWCSKCSCASLEVSQRSLYGPRGWASLSCRRCGKSSSAKFWKCACGVAWPTCLVHRSYGYACVTKSRPHPQVHAHGLSHHKGLCAHTKRLRVRRRVRRCVCHPPSSSAAPLSSAMPTLCQSADPWTKRQRSVLSELPRGDATAGSSSASAKRTRDEHLVPRLSEPASTRRRQADHVVADARSRSVVPADAASLAPRTTQASLRDALSRLLQ